MNPDSVKHRTPEVRPGRRSVLSACIAALLGILSASLTVCAAQMIRIETDPVHTSTGLVAGTRLPSGVHAYLGIPYAKPPVDNLRWQPPQPIHWDGVWNADRKTPECIQVLRQHDINHYFGEEATGEDCLYLNVWAPANAKPGAKLPVIVFIFGGGGTIGSAGMAHYDGENVAKNGAIFVNINYRVGILGMMAHPELTREQGGHSGNYTYLDQNAALKWIHDNVAAFGGDPSKLVVSGQSFGAGSVAAQILSPLSKGLFSAAFTSSGCNFNRDFSTLAEGEKIGLDIQKRLGVPDLAGMRNMPADKLLTLQAETQNLVNNPGVKVSGVIDGYFWTGTPEQTLAAHAGSAVPILANSNSDDNDAARYPLTRAHTVSEYKSIAQQMYGANADQFLQLYPATNDSDVYEMAHQAAMDNGYLIGDRSCGEAQARFNSQPLYVDLFVRKHPYTPGVKIADQNTATVGAYHNSDIPYWFGTLDSFNLIRNTRTWTQEDRALSEKMMHALIAFAKTGKPEIPDFSWPAWTEAKPEYVVLGGDKVQVRSMDLKKMDWLAAHPPAPVKLAAPEGLRPHD